MHETSKSPGKVPNQYQELPMEETKQRQQAQECIARPEDNIGIMEELGPLVRPAGPQRSSSRVPVAELNVGGHYAPRILQAEDLFKDPVKGLIKDRFQDMQKLEIRSIDNTCHAPKTTNLNYRRKCLQPGYIAAAAFTHDSTTSEIRCRYFVARLDPVVGHEIFIGYHTVGAGYDETHGTGSGEASANPSCSPQKEPLTSSSHALRRSKNREKLRRQRGSRDGDDRPFQRRTKSQSGPSNASLLFACPFYLHNKEEHQNCLNYELKRIVDVRLHIYRFHVQPSYCPWCRTVFQDDPTYAQRDAHVNQRVCGLTGDVFRHPGATSDQLGSMTYAGAHGRGSNDVERWYTIWDIMFPSAARPPSPYIDVAREWTRIEVNAAVDHYQLNGGVQDFMGIWGGDDLSLFLNLFLAHFRDFSAAPGDSLRRDSHDTPGDPTTEAQGIISLSSLSPSATLSTQSHSLSVPQPTVSPVTDLPILLPRPTHPDSASLTTRDQDHGSALPTHDPNLDASDENPYFLPEETL
ncbi:hypothetical protein F5Y19DRAFT_326086 [Xylariaceae sp. FL1651]|nr:hypothetical protein F5Y19DRAFT_326086 [Xylariaceae sp. FL1651]